MNPSLPNLTAWETPQRQSLAAILIIFLKTMWGFFTQFGIVLIIMLFQKPKPVEAQSYNYQAWLFYAFLGLTVVVTFLRYWFYKFSIKDEYLHIHSGWWQKTKLAVPLKSIQAVHLEQNIWQQMLGVARVSFDSAGSEQMEARIDALPLKKAESLKKLVLASPSAKAGKEVIINKTYHLSEEDVWKLSLSANHFKAFLLIIIFGFQFVDDIINAMTADQKEAIEAYADSAWGRGLNLLFIGVVFFMVAFISIAISTVRVLLEYHNFKMDETPQGWKVSQGLLTQKQKVISSSKIQLVEYSANWLRAWLNIWLVKLNITGQDKTKQQAHLSVPIISLESVHEFTKPYLAYAPVRGAGKGIDSAYWWRSTLLFAVPISLMVSAFFYVITWHLWFVGILFIVNILYGAIHFYIWRRRFRWIAQEEGLWVYKGVWGQTYTLLHWQKIQQVHLLQNLYQHKHGLADLRLVTAGGELIVPYLPLPTAQVLLNHSLHRIESRQEKWL